jgi:retron-type reverse transcriptase
MLDADIRDFFTSVDRRWLERFLEHRIADMRVLRLIRKWLSAGIIEDGAWAACDDGVPQGQRFHRSYRTSICTTSWTCGPTSGGAATLTAM